MARQREEKTIYEELGGEPVVAATVEIFYRNVLADQRIAHFFTDVDMQKQVLKQKSFLTMIFGGPNRYTGRDIRHAHSRLLGVGLNDHHVDALLEDLGLALNELSIRKSLAARILAKANSFRDEVLSRDEP